MEHTVSTPSTTPAHAANTPGDRQHPGPRCRCVVDYPVCCATGQIGMSRRRRPAETDRPHSQGDGDEARRSGRLQRPAGKGRDVAEGRQVHRPVRQPEDRCELAEQEEADEDGPHEPGEERGSSPTKTMAIAMHTQIAGRVTRAAATSRPTEPATSCASSVDQARRRADEAAMTSVVATTAVPAWDRPHRMRVTAVERTDSARMDVSSKRIRVTIEIPMAATAIALMWISAAKKVSVSEPTPRPHLQARSMICEES